ncbi:ATP-binding response regulator [Ramlibacter sp. MMS24-I3-19]|uniref:ATP-binding response regulator n=1 Tax=Ramlibacter sp. MMS24-I3-19 TaxID=3416606 RepID=UPI003D0149FB
MSGEVKAKPAPELPPVLIHAPGRDGALSCSILTRAGHSCHRCTSDEDLLGRLCDGASALLIAEECLTDALLPALRETLSAQSAWSDLPVFVVTLRHDASVLQRLDGLGNLAVLTRPMAPEALVSAVALAVRARRRQFEVRDLLKSQLDQARRKDEFMAMLAHELRNPLAPVRYAAHMIQAADLPRERRMVIAALVDKQVAHMGRLIEQLLDVTRMNRGMIELEHEAVDLREVVRQAVDAHRAVASARNIALSCDAADAVWIQGDATRLRQVTDNLLDNAVKYSFAGGRVRVTLDHDGADARLRLDDEGDGIAAADLGSIFEPFVQGDRSLDRAAGGLGLGLSMVRSLVELHGGSVHAQSDGKGRGSRFEVRLPLLRQPLAGAAQPGGDAGADDRALDILLVEDNTDAADVLRMVLEMSGHRVVVAHAGDVAVDVAADMRFDAVVCDIGLPGLDGYGVARALRAMELHRGTFLLAVTGYGDAASHQKGMEAGFDDLLAKPLQAERLLQLLARPPVRAAQQAAASATALRQRD